MESQVTNGTKFQVSNKMTFFIPKKAGVHLNINSCSRAGDVFFELFDGGVQETLVNLINEFADRKMQQNTPTTVHSRYPKWYSLIRYELLKMFCVFISMGVNRRPNLYDYWSLDTYNYTTWHHEMFPRNNFEIICSTMFHVNSAQDKEAKKQFRF